jgi:hypothetical protein
MGLQAQMVRAQGGEEAVRAKASQERLLNGDMSQAMEAQKGTTFEGTGKQNRVGRRLLDRTKNPKT